MKLITERTESILMGANLGKDVKSLLVPDNHSCMDDEQQNITNTFKAAFGCEAAEATFKIAIDKKDERHVYEPSVMAKDGKVVIDWGGKTYPVPSNTKFQGGRCLLTVEIEEVEYSLRVRVIPAKKEDCKTKTQLAWLACEVAGKSDFLNNVWSKGTIVEILAQAYPTISKLSECIGTHEVVGYKMGTGQYPKFLLELSDKRVVRANTALHEKLSGYDAMGIEVSPECPAQLTVGKCSGQTSSGFDIYPTVLVSHRNVNLPVYDFGFASVATSDKVTEVDAYDFSNVPF